MRGLVLVLLLGACSGDPNTHCSGFVGDSAQPPALEIFYLTTDSVMTAAAEGTRMPLIEAPQGGKHVFAGARVKNMDTCPVKINGVVRDLTSRRIRFEERPVQFLDGEDGWAYPEERTQISSFANIPLCPNNWADQAVNDQGYQLEITVTDRAGRTATAMVDITPYCAQPAIEARCRCECAEGAVLGSCTGT